MVNVQATGMVRINFCGPHLWAAARFAGEAHVIEAQGKTAERPPSFYDETRDLVVATIFLSVASVEAWAGEIAADPGKHFPGKELPAVVAGLAEMVKWSSVEKKYERLAELAGGDGPDFGTDPDSEMRDLIFLRNKLVHFHAEWPDSRKVHDEVVQRLEPRFTRSPLLHESGPFFPDAFGSYDCARWSVETARKFVERFAAQQGWTHPWTKPVHAEKLVLPS